MSKMNAKAQCNILIAITALFGALGVIAGALGAHTLKDVLETSSTAEAWKTAVIYNLVHAVAGLAVASNRDNCRPGPVLLWVTGVCLFSGSLYLMALGGPRWLGPITPLGGALLIAGWIWIAVSAFTGKHREKD